MSNENDFAASLNRLEILIDSNQAKLKRDVESIITESDRRYGSLKEELNRLKSSHSSLGQITDLLALLTEEDNQHNLGDLPDRIRAILSKSTITPNKHVHRQTHDLDVSETGVNDTVDSVNIPDEHGTEGHVNGLEINVPSTGITNDGTHLRQSKSENEQVNSVSFDPAMSSISTANERQRTIVIEHDQTTDEDEYHQIYLPEGVEELGDNQNEFLPDESNETNQNIDKPIGQPVDRGSSSPQSISQCKGVMADLDGEDISYCDSGSDERIIKQEIKEEFDETGEIEIQNNGQSSQLGTQVKEEAESDEENVIGPEDGDALNDNQNESLSEQANFDSLGLPSFSTAIEHDQTSDETGFNCSNYIEVYAEDQYQIDISNGGEVLGDNQNELLPEESNETNRDISASVPASPSDIPVIIKVEGSSSPQSVRVCKGWIAEIDGEDLWYCDCGSDECIVKQEIKDEFDETGQIEIGNNDQSVQLGTRVKEEVESGEENVIGPEDGEELNDNQMSNGTNQCTLNGNPIDNQQVNNGELAMDECNESQTLRQSKTRKRKRTGKSLATESENLLENSLPSIKGSTPIPRSKRIRVTSPLETETIEDLSNGDNQNGIDSSGGRNEITEQTGDKEGGNCTIEVVNLKCIEDECSVMVANKRELAVHLRNGHDTSLPYRCLANGCSERFVNWKGQALAKHVEDYHSDISTWSCAHCTKTSKTLNNLYRHLYQHHFEGEFKCGYEGCNYEGIGTFRSEIVKHQQSVHPKSSIYTCQINKCGKSFKKKYNFDCHQRIHQGVKPFKCTWNVCRYTATADSNVIAHIRTQHFHLPATQKEQRKRGIEDHRNPRDYLLNTNLGHQLNVNQNESLHDESNGTTQYSVNDKPIDHVDQQMDNGYEPKEPANDELQTSKQPKTRKGKCADKSLVTESENLLENSVASSEMDIPGPRTSPRSKRTRVTSPLERESTEQLSTGSEVYFSEGDNPNDNNPSGEDDLSEDDERLQDDEVGGYYKIEVVNLKCHECSVVVASKPELFAHFQDKHDTPLPYRCLANGCSERFDKWTGKALDKHVQDKHSDISIWRCPHCPTTSQTQKSVYDHLHKFHFEGSFRCGYDGCPDREIATLRSVVRNHQYKDHPNPSKIYKCEFADCGKTFKQSGNFKVHQQIHTGVKPFRCDLNGCGMLFTQKMHFERHLLRHQGVKPYKCKKCGYTATDSSGVLKHIRTRHFLLPATQKVQRERGIQDDRDPREYLMKTTTHQSDHKSTD